MFIRPRVLESILSYKSLYVYHVNDVDGIREFFDNDLVPYIKGFKIKEKYQTINGLEFLIHRSDLDQIIAILKSANKLNISLPEIREVFKKKFIAKIKKDFLKLYNSDLVILDNYGFFSKKEAEERELFLELKRINEIDNKEVFYHKLKIAACNRNWKEVKRIYLKHRLLDKDDRDVFFIVSSFYLNEETGLNLEQYLKTIEFVFRNKSNNDFNYFLKCLPDYVKQDERVKKYTNPIQIETDSNFI
jgi:hypothetical protein